MAAQEKEVTSVQLDHCYAKPWVNRVLNSIHRPAYYLHLNQAQTTSKPSEDEIDVDSVEILTRRGEQKPSYLECKIFALKPEDSEDFSEENMRRDGWTTLQQRLMNKVLKLLSVHRLGCLAIQSRDSENVQRKLQHEASSKKLRVVLASISWDIKLTQWLHLTLLQNLGRDLLIAYVETLQALRPKVPSLIDRMLNISTPDGKLASLATQVVNLVLEKKEDEQSAPNPNLRLQSAPFFIMVPSGSNSPNSSFRMLNGSKRFQKWQTLFQVLGKVVSVSLHTVTAPQLLPMPVFVDAVINATIQRIQELKLNCPGRPIVLVGLQHGALMAAQVASLERVDALVLLGMPTTSIDGKRGEPDDPILDLKTPVMFVVGQNSCTTSVQAVEHMRQSMKIDTALVVVPGATDSLKMLHKMRWNEGLLQSNVDNSILERVSLFLGSVLTSQPTLVPLDKNAPSRLASVERRTESGSVVKRVRLSTEKEDLILQTALSGHNYSSPVTPPTFTQPRGRAGLSRVRGGRTRAPYGRAISDTTASRGRGVRYVGNTPLSRSEIAERRRSVTLAAEASIEARDLAGRIPAALDENSLPDYKGGDSSETESAPPPENEDMDDIMEDLRFREELMEKHERMKKMMKSEARDVSEGEIDVEEKKPRTSSSRKPKVKKEAEELALQLSTEEDDLPERKSSKKKRRRVRSYNKRSR